MVERKGQSLVGQDPPPWRGPDIPPKRTPRPLGYARDKRRLRMTLGVAHHSWWVSVFDVEYRRWIPAFAGKTGMAFYLDLNLKPAYYPTR